MKILMISAKSQHGKDTVANLMYEQLIANRKTILTIHFADLVKFYAEKYYNWNGEKDEDGRALLQTIGTTIMRARWPEYWAEIVGKFLDAIGDNECRNFTFDYILIPDWRFINEFDTISKYARLFNNPVITIRVERFNLDGTCYTNPQMTEDQLSHISECELDNFSFDWIIENRGTIEDLKDSVDIILERI